MRSISIRTMFVTMALVAASFALAGTAGAAGPVEAEIVVPRQLQVGQPVVIQAALVSVDDALPVSNTPVIFYTDASFGDVTGDVELGRAVTDENGVAVLEYETRLAGVHQIRVEWQHPGEDRTESASAAFSVAGGTQLYLSTAGVDIPGLNVWIIIAVVSVVWAILLFGVALRVVAIARAGDEGGSPLFHGVGG